MNRDVFERLGAQVAGQSGHLDALERQILDKEMAAKPKSYLKAIRAELCATHEATASAKCVLGKLIEVLGLCEVPDAIQPEEEASPRGQLQELKAIAEDLGAQTRQLHVMIERLSESL